MIKSDNSIQSKAQPRRQRAAGTSVLATLVSLGMVATSTFMAVPASATPISELPPGRGEKAGIVTRSLSSALQPVSALGAETADLDPGVGQFAAGVPSAAHSTMTHSECNIITSDGIDYMEAIVTVRDNQGNPVGAGHPVAFTVEKEAVATPSAGITDGQGMVTVRVTSERLGLNALTVTVGGEIVPPGTLYFVFLPGKADFTPGHTALETTGGSKAADGVQTHIVTVKAVDVTYNVVAGATIVFNVPAPLTATSPISVVTDSRGEATVTVTSTTAGPFAVTATLNDTEITNGSPAPVTFAP